MEFTEANNQQMQERVKDKINRIASMVHGKLILIDSKVSAPVGAKVYGFRSVYLQNDFFNCKLGVKYTQAPIGDVMINNTFCRQDF
jgi:hypothetical protein